LNTLGDVKNFTATELGNLNIPAGLVKDLEAKNFLKPGNDFVTALVTLDLVIWTVPAISAE